MIFYLENMPKYLRLLKNLDIIMGIKSFQGARRQQSANTDTPSLTVSDYMTTSLITFTRDQSIESVMQSLIKHRISGGCFSLVGGAWQSVCHFIG